MAKRQPKIVLAPAQGIPLNRLVLSQSNVRRVKNGVTIEDLANDIERRGLLQGLSVRPLLDAEGQDTGTFHVPAGGRRFRALEILVKRKRLAADAVVPCVVKPAVGDVSAEEDSYAENAFREPLHPLDEFRGMQQLVDQGGEIEEVAARFISELTAERTLALQDAIAGNSQVAFAAVLHNLVLACLYYGRTEIRARACPDARCASDHRESW